MKAITVKTCQFVEASDFFDGFKKYWNILCKCDNLPFSWGDNNRSMVVVQDIFDAISSDVDDMDDISEEFEKHCKTIGWQTYIDLEN